MCVILDYIIHPLSPDVPPLLLPPPSNGTLCRSARVSHRVSDLGEGRRGVISIRRSSFIDSGTIKLYYCWSFCEHVLRRALHCSSDKRAAAATGGLDGWVFLLRIALHFYNNDPPVISHLNFYVTIVFPYNDAIVHRLEHWNCQRNSS